MRNIPTQVALRALAAEVLKARDTVTDEKVDQLMRAVQSVMEAVADEWDDCVQWRLDEIAAFAALLRRGEALAEPELAARLAAVRAAGPTADLRISTLDDRLDGLRAAAGELAAWLEGHPGPPADALWREIWQRLLDGLRRQSARPGMTAY
ncbi:hypothetical protein [Dactylosporangium sp. CA-092794]|uniref:hypothetical protein n=1 Tax=Dactylosporangium sp. CA-092794 TaxID=3239929 RepID=UPI003D925081